MVFRNFPLTEMHEEAYPAAVVAEAAAQQGKFWEMNSALFDNQDDLGNALFEQLAKRIGLDTQQFGTDTNKPDAFKEKIDADFEGGVRSGVNGTPSFYVNGEKFDGGPEDLLDLLNESGK